MSAQLIVCEGLDGCGKSTQIGLLAEVLRQRGLTVRLLREPGGTVLGEHIRQVLLNPATVACATAELLAYQVARAQLVHEVIQPALAAGEWVLLDRFWYSTIAYQAYGLGLDESLVRQAIHVALAGCQADHAIYCRLDPDAAYQRRQGTGIGADRIEARDAAYHQRVYAGYEAMLAQQELTSVDATADIPTIHDHICQIVLS